MTLYDIDKSCIDLLDTKIEGIIQLELNPWDELVQIIFVGMDFQREQCNKCNKECKMREVKKDG